MDGKFPPVSPKFPHFLHGGDYNPDQWFETPEIWDEDIRLMKLARCNTVSLGIFAWSLLEPEEGQYNFGWLDTVMDKLAAAGIFAVLATPSGARPAWMAQKYPEVLRVTEDRRRNLFGERHNHCFTSPVYRRKTAEINRLLAQRYGRHPALLAWHISNEYGGDCHCPLCQEAFRAFLKEKYGTLDHLNHEWWSGFWSHRYSDWSQIESPSSIGDKSLHALQLDWKRFVTHQTIDFYRNEIRPLRELTPGIPITTNFMGLYPGLDYQEFAKDVDVVSWDNYPSWHNEQGTENLGAEISFVHDLNRSLKDKPFLMMESTPSLVNWKPVNKLKRPGMHMLSSLQAVAHGSDSVQYFQWRSGRGAFEKFHGAVVSHSGHEHTRAFADVTQVGQALERLDPVLGAGVRPEVAILYDWQNRWALEEARALSPARVLYPATCQSHYFPFWKRGIPVDVIGEEHDFSAYKLLVAPMLYMVRPGVAERIAQFVKDGGTLLTTYWSGIVNENDLCFIGGFPGPLREVTGVWSEEIDSLYENERNTLVMEPGNELGLAGEFAVTDFCDLIHAESAKVLATYRDDFYAGRPALTVNRYGKGRAYYLAARAGRDFLGVLAGRLAEELSLKRALDAELPAGVTAQLRTAGNTDYVFLMNFSEEEKRVTAGRSFRDLLTDEMLPPAITLPPYGVKVLEVGR